MEPLILRLFTIPVRRVVVFSVSKKDISESKLSFNFRKILPIKSLEYISTSLLEFVYLSSIALAKREKNNSVVLSEVFIWFEIFCKEYARIPN